MAHGGTPENSLICLDGSYPARLVPEIRANSGPVIALLTKMVVHALLMGDTMFGNS
jgi:hypothetical protein